MSNIISFLGLNKLTGLHGGLLMMILVTIFIGCVVYLGTRSKSS